MDLTEEISIRRFFLNVSIIGLVIGVFVLVSVVVNNLSLKKTVGTVIDYEIAEYNYQIGDKIEVRQRKHPIVEYDSIDYGIKNGEFYWLDGDAYAIGDTVPVYLDRNRYNEAVYPTSYLPYFCFYILPFGLLLLFCRKAFVNYRRDFLQRYARTIRMTVAIELIAVSFSVIWYAICSQKTYCGFMPGLSALGDFLFMCIIDGVAILSILILWLVSCIRFVKHRKKGAA